MISCADTIHSRNAFLMNWLANLGDKVDGFKEMDLLQEHQNFWAKVLMLIASLSCYGFSPVIRLFIMCEAQIAPGNG
jgi:hypothetical protein